MKYSIRKNWMSSLELMAKKPVIILPFFIVAFLECLALEIIFFSVRKPLLFAAGPIIRKLYGEVFTHYPYNLAIVPKLFYNAQIAIYIFAGVFLTAVCVNILKNAIAGLPIKSKALAQNASRRYPSFIGLGIILIVITLILAKIDLFVSIKLISFVSKYAPVAASQFGYLGFSLSLFISNVILQIFLISTIPLMVMWKQPLLKALGGSIVFGFRNFVKMLGLIFLPFLIYLPVTFLKNYSGVIADKTVPEATLFITMLGIVITPFVDCFVIVCVTRFLIEKIKPVADPLRGGS